MRVALMADIPNNLILGKDVLRFRPLFQSALRGFLHKEPEAPVPEFFSHHPAFEFAAARIEPWIDHTFL